MMMFGAKINSRKYITVTIITFAIAVNASAIACLPNDRKQKYEYRIEIIR